MNNEIEARELTNKELKEQIKRIVEYNINPNWSDWEKSHYLSGISVITMSAGKKTFTMRGQFNYTKEHLYEYIRSINGEVKKDELTIKEEEMERRYEERQLEERRKNEEEKEKAREARKKKRIEKRNKIIKRIRDFFRNIKNKIVKKLTSRKGALSLDSGEPEDIKTTSGRERLIEELTENLDNSQGNVPRTETKEEKREERIDKKPKEKDER